MNRTFMETKMYKFLIVIVLCTTAFSSSLYAQIDVSGVVTDDAGTVLSGVSVQVKGTANGTKTNENGSYSIEVANENAVLSFSLLGYGPQEFTVGDDRRIDIILMATSSELEEAVVVAYGTQKKESVVAAISTMDATGLLQTPASNIGIALAGRLPGLTVLQRSGVPGGEMMEFYIRGRSTINGQQPLILVDGVPRYFTALDRREVATIPVLKDD